MLSYRAELVPLEPLVAGSLLALLATSIGPVTVPPSGTAQLPFRIPSSGWPVGQTYYGQWVTLELQTRRLWVSNSFPWHTSR